MAAYQCGQNIYYRSFREIAVNEELLVWYSDSYQKHLEIPLSLKESDQANIEGTVISFPKQKKISCVDDVWKSEEEVA